MQELIQELVDKTGLTEEKAQQVATTALNFIKSKLPSGIADKLEGIVSGQFDVSSLSGNVEGGVEGGLNKLKSMFGDNKDTSNL